MGIFLYMEQMEQKKYAYANKEKKNSFRIYRKMCSFCSVCSKTTANR